MSAGRICRQRPGVSPIWVLIAVALAAGLAGCGKRGELKPPAGEESRYTYPRPYPDPKSVLPSETGQSAPRSLEAPVHAGDLSPFPGGRRTTTYGQPPVQ